MANSAVTAMQKARVEKKKSKQDKKAKAQARAAVARWVFVLVHRAGKGLLIAVNCREARFGKKTATKATPKK